MWCTSTVILAKLEYFPSKTETFDIYEPAEIRSADANRRPSLGSTLNNVLSPCCCCWTTEVSCCCSENVNLSNGSWSLARS
ncbi:tRNA-guanine(15) transglycosylase [Trichinella pseudospiralis]